MPRLNDFEFAALRFVACPIHGVRWITEAERDAIPWPNGSMRRAVIPFGQPAGGRIVHGHGRLVMFRKLAFTTADVLAMLADGGRWPWEPGAHQVRGVASSDDAACAAIVRASVALDGDAGLRWIVSPHSTIPAGSPVAGMALAGSRRCLMRGGIGYMTDDVRHLLAVGRWPWEPEWN